MQQNRVNDPNNFIDPGVNNNTNNPNLVQGALQFATNVNVLKMTIECVDNVAAELIRNLNSDNEVSMSHLIRTIRSSFNDSRIADQVLSQYIVPIKSPLTLNNFNNVNQKNRTNYNVGQANQLVPNWDRVADPLPKTWTVVSNNRVICGYKLNVAKLTFNQATSLLIGIPKFVLLSCVYVDQKNKVNTFSNLKEILDYFLHIRVPYFNKWLALEQVKAQNKTEMLRNYIRDNNGNNVHNPNAPLVTVNVVQYSHLVSFANVETEAFIETSSDMTIGRVGIKRGNDVQNVYGFTVTGTSDQPVFTWVANQAAPDLAGNGVYYANKQNNNFTDIAAGEFIWAKSTTANYGDLSVMGGIQHAGNVAFDGNVTVGMNQAVITTAQIQSIWKTLVVHGAMVNNVPVRSFRV